MRVRCVSLILLAVTTLLWQPHEAAAGVIVMARTDAGWSFGSGVHISSDGTLLTCYHVVQGAKEIRVISQRQIIPDEAIVVQRIDPSHDLASLTIHPGYAFESFPISSDVPTTEDDLKVVGYIGGLPHQTVWVRTTQTGYARSGQLVLNGKSPFALPDVSLIPLNMLIYGGMSGSPLIFRGKTIGIVSGSLNEGGSLGWAIPATYITSTSALIVQKRASSVAWLPLRLMAAPWSNLRRQIAPMTVASESIQRTSSIGRRLSFQLRTMYDKFRLTSSDTMEAISATLRSIPANQDNARLRDLVDESTNVQYLIVLLRRLGAQQNDFREFFPKLMPYAEEITAGIMEIRATLAQAKDTPRAKEVLEGIEKLGSQLNRLDGPGSGRCYAIDAAAESVHLGREMDFRRTIGDLKYASQQACQKHMDEFVHAIVNMLDTFSEAGDVLQSLLEEPILRTLEAQAVR